MKTPHYVLLHLSVLLYQLGAADGSVRELIPWALDGIGIKFWIGLFLILTIHGIAFKWLCERRRLVPKHVSPIRPPLNEVLQGPCEAVTTKINFPKVPLFLSSLSVRILFSKFGRAFLFDKVIHDSHIDKLLGHYIPDRPTFLPLVPPDSAGPGEDDSTRRAKIEILMEKQLKTAIPGQFRFRSVSEYREAYSTGKVTPVDIVKATFSAIAKDRTSSNPLKAFTFLDEEGAIKKAELSMQRWKDKRPLSCLDGIPVALKEAYKWKPLPYTCGSAYQFNCGNDIPNSDIGQKLERSGAIVVGVTTMVEFGTSPIGSNPNKSHGTPRNPYNTKHYTGGSSSGSCAAVAGGMIPITAGTDGGGSVRVPSAFCGIVGLKPTFARLVDRGYLTLCNTVGHAGLHATCVADIVAAYNMVTGKIPEIPESLIQPPITLEGIESEDLKDVKIGIDLQYNCSASKELYKVVNDFVNVDLKSAGAEIKEIKIHELDLTRLAHIVTIGSEMGTNLASEIDSHFSQTNLETLFVTGVGWNMTAPLYINSQKQRTRCIEILRRIFKEVDCIITPATGIAPPEIPPTDESYGFVDPDTVNQVILFSFLGNLAGVPAVVIPVGYLPNGLPIGLQVMGRWWEEHVILRVAQVAEQLVERKGGKKRPEVYHDLLQDVIS